MTSGFSPENVESPLTKLKDALFDNGGFLLEILLPRRKEEREFGMSEDFNPCVDVVG